MRKIILIYRWSVYYWQDYRFENGSSRNKFWIPLNCSLISPCYNSTNTIPAIIPTSQVEKYYGNRLIDTIRIVPGESRFFSRETIIDLKNIQWNSEELINKAIQNEKLKYIGKLEDSIVKKIEQAIEEAETIPSKIKKFLLCSDK